MFCSSTKRFECIIDSLNEELWSCEWKGLWYKQQNKINNLKIV